MSCENGIPKDCKLIRQHTDKVPRSDLMLRSDLCDYSDAYIVVKRTVTVSADERDKLF